VTEHIGIKEIFSEIHHLFAGRCSEFPPSSFGDDRRRNKKLGRKTEAFTEKVSYFSCCSFEIEVVQQYKPMLQRS